MGRPPLKTLRAGQIVDAFIELVAAHGLEHVSLDDVADRAEVKRAALRHFVGNREDLIDAAITEITHRTTADLSETPTITGLINMLFSPRRITEKSVEADAWTALLGEALRSDNARAVVKGSYQRLLTVIADSLRHSHPRATDADIRGTAYAIACLAEQNWNFQLAGLPRARGADAKAAALRLAAQLP